MTKISALPEDTAISDDDIIYKVDDPGGSPLSRKITWANIKANLKTFFDTLYASALGPDDNYVTDTEKGVIGNTSGTNSGDQDLSSFATKTGTETFTNKRITARINTITSSATPTPAGDTTDEFTVTALAVAATFAAPTGTPTEGQILLIRIKDNATPRTLAWNAIYRASTDLVLPTTTISSKTLYLQFVYNNTDSKWDLLGLLNNF